MPVARGSNTTTTNIGGDEVTQVNITGDTRNLKQQWALDGKLFTVSTNVITLGGASTETAFILIRNPASSGKNLFINSMHFRLATNSSYFVILRKYDTPTVTSDGTELTSFNELSTGPAAVSKWFVTPTVSANGTFRNAFSTTEQFPIGIDYELSRVVEENQELLLTVKKNSSSNTDFIATIYFGEDDV